MEYGLVSKIPAVPPVGLALRRRTGGRIGERGASEAHWQASLAESISFGFIESSCLKNYRCMYKIKSVKNFSMHMGRT